MGWLDGGWANRVAITVDLASWSSGAIDIEVTIPQDWDAFWDDIDNAGAELRAVAQDGYTLLTYDLSGFNKATRTCNLQIDGLTPTTGAEGVMLLWLYYGNSGAPDASTAVTITSPFNGYICLASPRSDRTIVGRPEASQASVAKELVAKEDDVTTYLWWDVTQLLHGRRDVNNNSATFEEIDYAGFAVEAAGVPQAGMSTAGSNRFVELDRRMYVATLVKAGTAPTVYLAKLTLTTTSPGDISQVVVAKSRLKVQDITES